MDPGFPGGGVTPSENVTNVDFEMQHFLYFQVLIVGLEPLHPPPPPPLGSAPGSGIVCVKCSAISCLATVKDNVLIFLLNTQDCALAVPRCLR